MKARATARDEEEDLSPLPEHGSWVCGSCRRAFALRFLGLEVAT
jgi:hypothetical protein